jgi:predicted enzyme related to lactoylglutathione lyase
MMSLAGRPVAAVAPQPEFLRNAGAPPLWQSYISVENAAATLDAAAKLGASVQGEAFDVMDVGRMGIVRDPQGATFMVWEPKLHIGAGLVNGHGMLSWNELGSPDLDASARFYGNLFGWQIDAIEGMEMPYLVVKNAAGSSNGGIRPPMPAGAPASWLVYFGSDNIEASLVKVGDLGGAALSGPVQIGAGTIAVAQDPQGAVFALFAGEFED